ncbi:MAG: acyl-CoA/acyl-ACP dehydrogenase [Betaproteobacteria bacterium]|nr:acyl-CoA/acyl-ACP dehydrogenase [Betaproteobacteria bacterium]
MSATTTDLKSLIAHELAPRVAAIDLEAHYPELFLRAIGAQGGFADVIAPEFGGSGKGLGETIATMAQIGETCLSTAFIHWCQTACARYIQLSDNDTAKRAWLPRLANGSQLGGTGLSNTCKSDCAIERHLLTARRVEGGYAINGTLPWVSNLGTEHIFVTGCPVEDDGRLVFFITRCNQEGFKLVDAAHFTALEGTRTLACQFRQVFIPDSEVLAPPEHSAAYLARIQPGMFLAQLGMGIGLIRDCVRLVESVGRTHVHINAYETDQADELRATLAGAEQEVFRLAARLDTNPSAAELPPLHGEILRIRLAGGELALRAANAAMLHQGARGYLRTATAQRRLREAYFIAIVTPSLKHLRREIAKRDGKAVS